MWSPSFPWSSVPSVAIPGSIRVIRGPDELARELLTARRRQLAQRSWTPSEKVVARRTEIADTRRLLDPRGRTGSLPSRAPGVGPGLGPLRRRRGLRHLRTHRHLPPDLSLIHISEPTRLLSIS